MMLSLLFVIVLSPFRLAAFFQVTADGVGLSPHPCSLGAPSVLRQVQREHYVCPPQLCQGTVFYVGRVDLIYLKTVSSRDHGKMTLFSSNELGGLCFAWVG